MLLCTLANDTKEMTTNRLTTTLTETSSLSVRERLRDLRRGGRSRGRSTAQSALKARTSRGAYVSTRSAGYLSYRNRIIVGSTGSYIVQEKPFDDSYIMLAGVINLSLLVPLVIWYLLLCFQKGCYRKNRTHPSAGSSDSSSSDDEGQTSKNKTTNGGNEPGVQPTEDVIELTKVREGQESETNRPQLNPEGNTQEQESQIAIEEKAKIVPKVSKKKKLNKKAKLFTTDLLILGACSLASTVIYWIIAICIWSNDAVNEYSQRSVQPLEVTPEFVDLIRDWTVSPYTDLVL